jgi:hypothetical protein
VSTSTTPVKRGSIAAAIGWMFLLDLLLFWVPVIGPLVAGFVGGRVAGSLGNAITAVFLPAIIFGILFFVLTTVLSAMPLLGALAGFGAFAFTVAHVGPLLIGAIAGGITAR